ncbi:MAG: Short-chain-fatty-acid--CoA ligase [Nitrosomonadaceae bacterium]|nr:Short-chain-fatty-acid--CoA ligase [Nitrosomonadaceae bacterium]
MSTILTLHDPQTAKEHYASGVWQRDTLYSLLQEHATSRPEGYAIRDSARRLTWGVLLKWVDILAADLHSAGLRRGQRVAVCLPNRVETIVVLLACSRNGYVCNPSLHQNYTVSEVMQLLGRIKAAALFAQPGYGADADKNDLLSAAKELSDIKRIYGLSKIGGDPPENAEYAPFPSLSRPGDKAPAADLNPDKITYLAFTSGTTGMPKGVLHSDNTLLANGRGMVKDWRHDDKTVLFSYSPLSHHIATVAIEQSLVAGFEVVVNDLPSGKNVLDWIVETGATYVMGVPTHAMDILSEMKRRGLNKLGCVNLFYMAGAVIPPQTARALLDMGIKPQNIYGMTECGSHQYTFPDDGVETITTTCGRACDGYETRLWGQENPDVEVRQGEVGEIGTRGGLLMLGYFDNQSATESSFNAGGWFMSGDLACFNAKGNLQIVGRKKDLIIRGGHNIYPLTIENPAMKHPGILKAAAFPVADERLGERVCLAVLPRDGKPIDATEMLQHLHEQGLSKYDMPEYFMCLDSFPQTASGKVLKRELIEWTKSGKLKPLAVRWNGPVR